MPEVRPGDTTPVRLAGLADGWTRPRWCGRGRAVAIESCPKSYITAESEGLVEEFLVRRRLGGMEFDELSARQVEAFVILEQALAAEEFRAPRSPGTLDSTRMKKAEYYPAGDEDGEHNTRRTIPDNS